MKKSSAPESRVLNVAIVEDDDKLRRAFTGLLNGTEGLRCIGEFSSCEEAIDAFERNLPHVLLMDIGLPGMSGIDGTRIIKERFPHVDIMMLTVYDDDEKVFASIRAGASGYVLKNAPQDELIRAIHDIRTGAPMSASIARRVIGFLRGSETETAKEYAPAQGADLTPRELDILNSLVEGLSYKRIADKLFISPLTVHTHIKRIYEKLQVHSKSAAVSKALKQKIVR